MKRILVVDDDPGFRKLLSVVIGKAGYTVEQAKSGHEAVAAIEKRAPDLVVLDIMMPGMSGYEVVHHIKFNQQLTKLPILVVSSQDAKVHSELGSELGVDYLHKSNSPQVILEKINKYFEHSKVAGKGGELDTPEAALLKKHDKEMWQREMRIIENYVRDALKKDKNKVGNDEYDDF